MEENEQNNTNIFAHKLGALLNNEIFKYLINEYDEENEDVMDFIELKEELLKTKLEKRKNQINKIWKKKRVIKSKEIKKKKKERNLIHI